MTHLIDRFTEHLKKGKYNFATITAYRNALFVFYNHFRDYPQSKFTDELISNYLLSLSNNKKSKYDSIQSGKAIKLFFEVIFGKKLNLKSTGKIKEVLAIDILTKEELFQLFKSIKNIKHRLLLMLIYNNGLKVNEIINLEITDIDMVNNTITIRHKNPKKDRVLRLSPNLNEPIEKYLAKYRPQKLFFPGSGGVGYYSARNIQLFFQKALIEAGLDKRATLNTLRHSYAVHCLEMGLDIHILQKILGHSNNQTTTVYMKFSKVNLQSLKTPIEFFELPV